MVLERHFLLSNLLFSENLAFYRVGKKTLEKVRLIKNFKQMKFLGLLRLAVTLKINSHKFYWAAIHCKQLSSPFLSSKQGFN